MLDLYRKMVLTNILKIQFHRWESRPINNRSLAFIEKSITTWTSILISSEQFFIFLGVNETTQNRGTLFNK